MRPVPQERQKHLERLERQDRTLAQQLSGAFMVFGAIVAAAFFITAVTYGVSWAWLTPEFERSRLAVRAESAAPHRVHRFCP